MTTTWFRVCVIESSPDLRRRLHREEDQLDLVGYYIEECAEYETVLSPPDLVSMVDGCVSIDDKCWG